MDYVIRHPSDLGAAIAEFRTAQGLTQAQLAQRVGLHRTYLSNIERGEVPAFADRLLALANDLGLTITISDS